MLKNFSEQQKGGENENLVIGFMLELTNKEKKFLIGASIIIAFFFVLYEQFFPAIAIILLVFLITSD